MLKRLGKKVLPIIMATMLVAGMCAVSTSAVEVSNNSEIAVVKDTPSVYVDEETGVKLESSDIIVNEENVSVVDNDLSQLGIEIDLYEKSYSFYVYDENYDEINCNETAVTAYVPFENDSCYVIYYDIENKKATQLDAEYVDGSYKFNMIGVGEYYICDSPLAEGEGEIVQQTLVNEQTGVTVSGAIQTDTKLVVIDVFELLKNIGLDFDSLKSMLEENPDLATSIDKEQIELLKQMDGYIVCLTRNFEMVNPQGELTITLPNGNDSFAVRYADVMSEFSSGEFGDMELPEIDYTDETKTDEELAQEYNANIDKQMPILESEYVDGSYVVNSTNSGLFLIAPKDILYTTAEEIK